MISRRNHLDLIMETKQNHKMTSVQNDFKTNLLLFKPSQIPSIVETHLSSLPVFHKCGSWKCKEKKEGWVFLSIIIWTIYKAFKIKLFLRIASICKPHCFGTLGQIYYCSPLCKSRGLPPSRASLILSGS